jgi:16S rRNA (adenine1518-N6/adenine1519-N6)-dimethyltransferase
MVAKPGTADYSRLSVNCSVRADVELLENVPKDRYYPEPKVDSTVVRLTPKHVDLPPKFDDITRALFQHKNKKVRNALIDSAHEISQDKEKVKEWADSLWEIKEKKVISLAPEDIIQLASTF